MNQDFFIPSSPGMARNIFRLSTICKLRLDPDLEELAAQDFVTDEEFEAMGNLRKAEKNAIQTIIDSNFRAVVPGRKGVDQMLTMTAIKLKKIEPIVVLTDNLLFWKKIAKTEGYTLGENFFALSIREIGKFDKKIFSQNRHGVLIISCKSFPNKVQRYGAFLARSFPRTIITAHGLGLKNMKDVANMLSPGCPVDLLEPNRNVMFKHNLSSRGFTSFEPIDLAFLCGIVTDAERWEDEVWSEDGEVFEMDPKWVSDDSLLEVVDDYTAGTEIIVF